ncbi:histidine kinase [Microcoleus sp. FACHB-1515]|uniref:histidine kinase n=1 Tax=Cyanophyceae TaxID=3028117 RepID=UPI001684AC4D|nr:histidine kinase [Microcoleus sp. FACHB-1515]MBD2089853.1 histidine kinase [Microcoleus sp. FACHB-1515]
MPESMKEQLSSDLKRAKEEGKLRSDRIREIVQAAVSAAISEFKGGSGEIRTIVKDAVSTVVEEVQERGKESQEEITAAIQGVVSGISNARRESIAKNQEEVRQLQSQIDSDEQALETEIHAALDGIEDTTKETPASSRSSIESILNELKDAFKNTDEDSVLRKRYAQLQAQLSILQANLAARYGERFEEVNQHLDTAKDWYVKARPQGEAAAEQVRQKSAELDAKLGEAGTAIAQKERRVRQLLKEALSIATDLFQEKLNERKK